MKVLRREYKQCCETHRLTINARLDVRGCSNLITQHFANTGDLVSGGDDERNHWSAISMEKIERENGGKVKVIQYSHPRAALRFLISFFTFHISTWWSLSADSSIDNLKRGWKCNYFNVNGRWMDHTNSIIFWNQIRERYTWPQHSYSTIIWRSHTK